MTVDALTMPENTALSNANPVATERTSAILRTFGEAMTISEIQMPNRAQMSGRYPRADGWRCTVTTFATRGNNNDSITGSESDEKSGLSSCSSIDSVVATKENLERLTKTYELPPKGGSRVRRYLQWNFFSAYRKLFALVLIVNIVVAAVAIASSASDVDFEYSDAATAASANLFVGLVMRNEHVINLLFELACLLPHWTPLWIRRRAAKVYSYGGIHSACGVCASLWFLVYTVLLTVQFKGTHTQQDAVAVISTATLILLLVLIVMAFPTVRNRWHDHWEWSHRYGGWTAVGLVWAQTSVIAVARAQKAHMPTAQILVRTPTFWFLIAITCLLVYPWTRLRPRRFRAENLSGHALRLHFDHARLETGVALRLTDAPLVETHGFATIPNPNGEQGFSVIMSKAGDWTHKIIKNPPKRIWVRGVPTLGVIRIALLFKKVIVIATGSGIGPCLSLLQSRPDHPMRVLWSAPSPVATFGWDIVKAVKRADPDSVIIDTKQTGRPDMVALAYALYREADAEAIVIISNPKVTKKVVYGEFTRHNGCSMQLLIRSRHGVSWRTCIRCHLRFMSLVMLLADLGVCGVLDCSLCLFVGYLAV